MDPINYQNPLLQGVNSDTSNIISTLPQEKISAEDKAAFDKKMQDLLDILKRTRPPEFTEEESRKIQTLLTELKCMPRDGTMDDAVNDILTMLDGAYKALTGKDDFANTFYFPPGPLGVALDLPTGQIDPVTKKELTFLDFIDKVGTTIIQDPNATKGVADMALAMVQDAFKTYTNRLEDLQKQIDISKTVINDLTDIQNILNMIDIDSPTNFTWNPSKWSDIPKGLQDILVKDYDITNVGGKNWSAEKFASAANTYFSQEIGWTANPSDAAGTLNKLIAARDSLTEQLAALKAAGADQTDPSGAYKTVETLLKDIEKFFPTTTYPTGTKIEMEYTLIGYEKFDIMGTIIEDKSKPIYGDVMVAVGPDGAKLPLNPSDLTTNLAKFISSGQTKNDGISDHINNAISANQNLSTKMTDEMKALNTWFQQLMDVLSAIEDAYNKGTTSYARNIRG